MNGKQENLYRIPKKVVHNALAWLAAIGIFALMVIAAHWAIPPAHGQSPESHLRYGAKQACLASREGGVFYTTFVVVDPRAEYEMRVTCYPPPAPSKAEQAMREEERR